MRSAHSAVNPFTALMSLQKRPVKIRNFKPFSRFGLLSRTGVLKDFSSKRIALKVDAIEPEDVHFAGASVQLSARRFYRLGQ